MMSTILRTTFAIALSVVTAGAALAEKDHQVASETGADGAKVMSPGTMGKSHAPMGMMGQDGMMGQMGMMQGDSHQMMPGMMKMMMQMHAGMGYGGAGRMGPATGGMGQMGMMDQDMMSLMRGPMMGSFDADGDGVVSGEEAHGTLQSMHAEADVNGDGSLSLEEYEALHAKMTRAMMIDRFQHLDADGDGKVTVGEMTAPVDRANMPDPAMPKMDGDGDMGMSGN